MSELKYWKAVNQALEEEMARDDSVMLFGEDSGAAGGVFGVSRGLQKRFGPGRVRDTPIAENSIVGMAVGAAAVGMRPIAEIMYADFSMLAMDQIVNQAAKYRYFSGGRPLPMVIVLTLGAGGPHGAQHSQSIEEWFCSVPGLSVVMPSTPADAYGLMLASIRADHPVLYFMSLPLLSTLGPPPVPGTAVEIGSASITHPGTDVTLVTYGRLGLRAVEAAARLHAEDDISVEVLDLRTLKPLDTKAILASVEKTGRLLILHEALGPHGIGAEIAALAANEGFAYLDAPVVRLTPPFVNVPASAELADLRIPGVDDVMESVRSLVKW